MKMLAIVLAMQAAVATSQSNPADRVLCPPAWLDSIVYYRSFDAPDGKPEMNRDGLRVTEMVDICDDGFHRGCGAPAAKSRSRQQIALTSDGAALSPHHPMTISIWWAAPEDVPTQGGFGLIHLGGRGIVSHFVHGGAGGWCGLKESAAVLQIYYLPGITNVNGIYNYKLHDTLGLKKNQWHHTAMVVSGASLVSIYTDGKLAYETRTSGRTFSPDDKFNTLRLGGGVLLDEVMVLDRPLPAGEIAEYVTAMRQMREAYGK